MIAKQLYTCSACLGTVEKVYQYGECKECLKKTFSRLRPLMKIQNSIPANQDLRESKGA